MRERESLMEKQPESVDVCIFCALEEEVRALREVVEQQCKVAFEKRTSTQYKYDYHIARIKNKKNELLTLHISWPPRNGPLEMTLHLPHVLEECQPRMAIMTGICAGDRQHVHLGDLIVAERTFTYDNGKFSFDEHGGRFHQHDTRTYELDADILQFLRSFDDWKRPLSPPGQHQHREVIRHITAMASGNAVRADNPFKDVQTPVRDAVAIDMEGAAFGLVMSRHPLIHWLVVKGVCDYADQDKNDDYHDYAARASALYALSFIRAYVTNEWPPRPSRPTIVQKTSLVDQQNRIRLLKRVHMIWIKGLLEQSLHGAAWTDLHLQEQPDALENRWRLQVQELDRAPHSLPAGTSIVQVYDEADGELLILGEPGAGKTTLLLELTRTLLIRAEREETAQMPVVFHLSSWAKKQAPLGTWLSEGSYALIYVYYGIVLRMGFKRGGEPENNRAMEKLPGRPRKRKATFN